MSHLVLIDRDGTVNVERHYLSRPEQIELLPASASGIKLLKSLNLSVVIVTNQSGVGRGFFDSQRLEKINDRLREVLSENGAIIDAIYFCPHSPEEGCSCRKPATGMAQRAAADFKFELSKSFVIGDKACDIIFGKNIGATTILVRTGYGAQTEQQGNTPPDYVADNLLAAAQLIKKILERKESVPQISTIQSMKDKTRAHLLLSAELKRAVAEECSAEIARAAIILIECLKRDGKILLCGNGGSAADCQHIAAELTSVLSKDFVRPGLAAIALTTDTSFITANANDFGFEGIFERQVQALGREGDALIGITTSGDSKNVLCALKSARQRGIKTIALTGETGGLAADIVDVAVKVPSKDTQLIQESHASIGHILCSLIETGLFNR